MSAVTRRPVCTAPRPYPPAPEVCGGCGNDLDKHKRRRFEPTQAVLEAMWKVMIALGGPHEAISRGPSPWWARQMREHMAGCGIDWSRTSEPLLASQPMFDDTLRGDSMQEILSGELYCLCGRYDRTTVTVDQLSLGELIWHAAHIDDKAAAS